MKQCIPRPLGRDSPRSAGCLRGHCALPRHCSSRRRDSATTPTRSRQPWNSCGADIPTRRNTGCALWRRGSLCPSGERLCCARGGQAFRSPLPHRREFQIRRRARVQHPCRALRVRRMRGTAAPEPESMHEGPHPVRSRGSRRAHRPVRVLRGPCSTRLDRHRIRRRQAACGVPNYGALRNPASTSCWPHAARPW